jgi:hypothetical protein
MDLQELIWTVKPGGPASFATPLNLPPRNWFRSCSAFAAASACGGQHIGDDPAAILLMS